MTLNEVIAALALEVIHLEDGERRVEDGYCGDLLSWVMGRAAENSMWITIMSNLNTVAVAVMADVAAVVMAEGVEAEDDVIRRAEQQGVNLLRSNESAFVLAGRLYSLLKEREHDPEV